MRTLLGRKKYLRSLILKHVIQSIPGLGTAHRLYLLRRLGIKSASQPLSSISASTLTGASNIIAELSTHGELTFYRTKILKYHRNFGTRRGLRMRQGLPRNGQRTRSNANTPRRFRRRKPLF